VGNFYDFRKPGKYTLKVALKYFADSNHEEGKILVSNEVAFEVLPFKKVGQKKEYYERWLGQYERGWPNWDYMVFQLATEAQYDELYYVQRIRVRDLDRLEWHRLCSVKPGTTPRVSMVGPDKVQVDAEVTSGEQRSYVIDFSKPGAEALPTAAAAANP
jgi:hypothetical protein